MSDSSHLEPTLLQEENAALRRRVTELEKAVAGAAARSSFPPSVSSFPPSRGSIPPPSSGGAGPGSNGRGTRGEALLAREALLDEIEQVVNLGSFVWEPGTNHAYYSEGLRRLLGGDDGAPSLEGLRDHVPEPLRGSFDEAMERLVAGELVVRELPLVRADGELRRIRLHGALAPEEPDEPRRIVGAVVDLTEAQADEERLRRAVAALARAQQVAKVGSFTVELAHGKPDPTQELRRMLHLEPGHASPESLLERVHPEDRGHVQSAAREALTNESGPPVELRVVLPGGIERHVYVDATPTHDRDGRLTGFIGTVLDITERKRMELELLHAQRMEALGLLSGGVAHDFNNYLQVISGSLDVLEQSVEFPPHVARTRTTLRAAVDRCSSLTAQLLGFSRKRRDASRDCDLNQLMRAQASIIELLVGRAVEVIVRLHAQRATVNLDPTQLEQVLLNLAVNARDAMPEGGQLVLESAEEPPPWDIVERFPSLRYGPTVRLTVRDTGEGVDPDHLDRIFEPFFTTKAPGHGTGLGLASVRWSVEHAGGAIAVDSQPGEGTAFHLYYPLRVAG